MKVSVNKFDINPLYCVSLAGFKRQCGLNYTGLNLQTLQVKELIFLLENTLRGGISSVMADRFANSD